MAMSIKKGDTVKILSGKDRGKQGTVLHAYPAEGKIKVEGVAIVKKAVRPNQQNQQGGIVNKESYIDISNVMYLHNGKPTRVGFKMDGDNVKASSVKKETAVKVVASNSDYVIFDASKDGKNRYDWDTATVYTITMEYKTDGVTLDTVYVSEGGTVEAKDTAYYTVNGDDLDLVFVIDEIK